MSSQVEPAWKKAALLHRSEDSSLTHKELAEKCDVSVTQLKRFLKAHDKEAAAKSQEAEAKKAEAQRAKQLSRPLPKNNSMRGGMDKNLRDELLGLDNADRLKTLARMDDDDDDGISLVDWNYVTHYIDYEFLIGERLLFLTFEFLEKTKLRLLIAQN